LLVDKNRSDKLVLQAHFLLPTGPSFADGANAILTANTSNFAGANQAAIRQIFVDRGFLTPQGVAPASLVVSNTNVVGGNNDVATVTLTAPAGLGGQAVAITTDQPIPDLPTTVTVPAGQTVKKFSFTPSGVDTTKNFSLHAASNGVTVNRAISVQPATLTTLTFNPGGVPGGTNTSGVVTLNGAAGPAGVLITLTKGSAVVGMPANVSVLAGQNRAAFLTTTTPVAATTVVTSSAKQGANPAINGNLTVSKAALMSLTLSQTNIVGGNALVLTARLDGVAPAGGYTVTLSTPTAAANLPASITIPAGKVAGAVTFTPRGVDATVSATLTGALSGVNKTANLVIDPATMASLVISPSVVAGGSPVTVTLKLNGAA
ncbi:MAG: hypothetical protein ABUL72_03790, partial [Armatimonadota bacterium]